VDTVGTVVFPEFGFEWVVLYPEGALILLLLEKRPVGIQRLRPTLLENDATPVLPVECTVDFPLPNKGRRNLLPRLTVFPGISGG
jgi:hypothetical protein